MIYTSPAIKKTEGAQSSASSQSGHMGPTPSNPKPSDTTTYLFEGHMADELLSNCSLQTRGSARFERLKNKMDQMEERRH